MIRPAAPVTTGHRPRTPIGASGRNTDRATERTQFRPNFAVSVTERTRFRPNFAVSVTERTRFRQGRTDAATERTQFSPKPRQSRDGTNPISPNLGADGATERTQFALRRRPDVNRNYRMINGLRRYAAPSGSPAESIVQVRPPEQADRQGRLAHPVAFDNPPAHGPLPCR
jgi:hypothetical protein